MEGSCSRLVRPEGNTAIHNEGSAHREEHQSRLSEWALVQGLVRARARARLHRLHRFHHHRWHRKRPALSLHMCTQSLQIGFPMIVCWYEQQPVSSHAFMPH